MARIIAVGTTVPPFRYRQEELQEAARLHFLRGLSEAERLVAVFETVQVRTRHFCVPLQWFEKPHSFEEKNSLYIEWAERLSCEAIEKCLRQAEMEASQVGHLIFVSTSGMSTPSIDARLINHLGFDSHVRRTPIFGLGCAGGAVGISRARELANGGNPAPVLVVAVELSSLTFQSRDFRKSNLVATSLFSDGAAAALISADGADRPGVSLLDSLSTLWPRSLDIMGWDFTGTGLSVVLSPRIPALVAHNFPETLKTLLERNGVEAGQIRHFVLHPGGVKILEALERSAGLHPEALEPSRAVLRDYGNMSSPTVLFVLEHLWRNAPPRPGDLGLAAAFGPGFSSELLLLRW